MARKKQTAGPAAPATLVAYVGPNLPGQPLQRNQIFREGLPPYVAAMVEREPLLSVLLVPVSRLSEARARVATPATREAAAAAAVRKSFANG